MEKDLDQQKLNEESSVQPGLDIQFKRPKGIADPFLSISKTSKDANNLTTTKSYGLVVCHQLPERSIHFRGRPVVCYRCAGTYVGFGLIFFYQLLGIILGSGALIGPVREWFVSFTGNNIFIQLLVAIVLQIPMIADGTYQAMDNDYVSNNPKRFITGLISGFGYVALALVIGSIYFVIKNLF